MKDKPFAIALTAATLCFTSLGLVACGGNGTSSGSPVTLASTYSGTEINNGTSAPVAVSFTQNGTQITGTWGNQFGGVATTGTLTGTVSGNTLTATLTSNIPGVCSSTVSGTANSGALSGTFNSTG